MAYPEIIIKELSVGDEVGLIKRSQLGTSCYGLWDVSKKDKVKVVLTQKYPANGRTKIFYLSGREDGAGSVYSSSKIVTVAEHRFYSARNEVAGKIWAIREQIESCLKTKNKLNVAEIRKYLNEYETASNEQAELISKSSETSIAY